MSEEKLLPCPFCGDEPELDWINEAGEVLTAWVSCKCGCEHHERLTKEVAVKKWNSRHLPNDAQASPESPYPIVEVFRKAPLQSPNPIRAGIAADIRALAVPSAMRATPDNAVHEPITGKGVDALDRREGVILSSQDRA